MNKRLDWIDAGKGIAMIFVIMGHCVFTPRSIVIALYTFHMPLFLFLSGYVISTKKYPHFIEFLQAKLKSIVWPYLMLSFILLVWTMIINNKGTFINSVVPKTFLGIFVAMRETPYYLSMWYLTVLFLGSLFMYFFIKLSKGRLWLQLLISVVTGALGYTISILPFTPLPWNADLVFTCVTFMELGYIAKKHWDKLMLLRKLYFLPISVTLFAVAGYFNHKNVYYTDLYCQHMGNGALYYIAAVAGIWSAIIVLPYLEKIKPITYVGRNSIIFYAFQNAIFVPASVTIVTTLEQWGGIFTNRYIECIIAMILACIGLAITSETITKAFPWVVKFPNFHINKKEADKMMS